MLPIPPTRPRGARQAAELGSLGMADEEVSAGSIKAGLAQKLAKLKTFTSYINMLAKKGLNKSLLRQIPDMGPEAGYAYAPAAADKPTFTSINSLETQLNHGADALGKSGADAMYDSGKNAGKGFLKGLESQQDAIEAQMLKDRQGDAEGHQEGPRHQVPVHSDGPAWPVQHGGPGRRADRPDAGP
ncbi:hypothetical protein [Streptomyces sp. NPDC048473]|uniref:hypothetical protein n=1 Tax=unclassified Streptomyces TaxID=2593676 RepID=UPI0037115102